MAVYIKVTAEVTVKIQDPFDVDTIEKAKENLTINTPDEIVEESYKFEVIDAD
jgi:hypothetical protein